MSRRRSFDYDEAKRLRAEGWRTVDLAARYGVTPNAVYRALNDEFRARQHRYASAWQQAHKMPCADGCGALVHGRNYPDRVCKACYQRRSATSVREATLQCVTCKVWKADRDFPLNRCVSLLRRGRHSSCRSCQTENKRAYRDARKVPCANGCGTMVDTVDRRDKTKPPECHACAMARLRGDHHRSRRKAAA